MASDVSAPMPDAQGLVALEPLLPRATNLYWLVVLKLGWPLIPFVVFFFWRWSRKKRLLIFSVLAVFLTLLTANVAAPRTFLVPLLSLWNGLGVDLQDVFLIGPYGFHEGGTAWTATQAIISVAVPLLLLWIFGRTIWFAPRMSRKHLLFVLTVYVMTLAVMLNGLTRL